MCNAFNHQLYCSCGWGPIETPQDMQIASYLTQTYDITRDFCKPSICPDCQERVYFIRYNGGIVCFDELGKPWPIHPCFLEYRRESLTPEHYSTKSAYSPLQWKKTCEAISKYLYEFEDACIGVGVEVLSDTEKWFKVFCSDNTIHWLEAKVQFNVDRFIDEFLIFSSTEGKLVQPFMSIETMYDIEDIGIDNIVVEYQAREDDVEILSDTVRCEAGIENEFVPDELLEEDSDNTLTVKWVRPHTPWNCKYCSQVFDYNDFQVFNIHLQSHLKQRTGVL